MDTLKTGFIVVLLLAVLYGVYVVLNKDQTPPNAEIAWHQQEAEKNLQIDIGIPTDPANANSGTVNTLLGGATPRGSQLGAPSVVTAELSPLPVEPAATKSPSKLSAAPSTLPPSTLPPSTLPPSTLPPANLPPFPAATPVSQESPVPTATPALPTAPSVTAPAVTSSTVESPAPGESNVIAPSLLPTLPATTLPPAQAETPLPSSLPANRTNDLSSLPSLREPGTGWPTSTPAAPAVRPAIKVPDRVAESDLPTSEVATEPKQELAPTVDEKPTENAPMASDTAAAAVDAVPAATDAKPAATATAFDAAIREAQTNLGEEQWYQALFVLSKFYDSSELTSDQREKLLDLLDPLAAKVVYSQEHLVTEAHEVRRGETLAQIATTHQVPPELIANINGLENPDLLVPGTKLKMVRGPFHAHVDLKKKELTLFAGHLYAGRFPISVGSDPEPTAGEYRVVEKQLGRDYFSSAGQRIAATDPQNPFGRVWIGLDKELSIHGSPERGDAGSMGCISLSPLDAMDVYGILTAGSSVIVRR